MIQIKLLVPNAAVGCVIGKQGLAISKIQQETSTTIIVSRSNSFYPDTVGNQDRVLLVRGDSVEAVVNGLSLILEKISQEGLADTSAAGTVRLLVHTKLCGCIIGKNGASIKSLQSESCKVVVGSSPARGLGLQERVVTISCVGEPTSSSVDSVLDTIRIILLKMMAEEPDVLAATMDDVVNYGETTGSSGHNVATSHSVVESLLVPDARIGAVIGKHGKCISGIRDLLNVAVTLSDVEGQKMCTLSGGSQEAVDIARQIVTMKIERTI